MVNTGLQFLVTLEIWIPFEVLDLLGYWRHRSLYWIKNSFVEFATVGDVLALSSQMAGGFCGCWVVCIIKA